jgi:hypothetical protein
VPKGVPAKENAPPPSSSSGFAGHHVRTPGNCRLFSLFIMNFLLCPACGDHFRGASHEMAPVALSCGHSCCSICTDAILLTMVPKCPICSLVLTSTSSNFALAGIAEAFWSKNDVHPNREQGTWSASEAACSPSSHPVPELDGTDSNPGVALLTDGASSPNSVEVTVDAASRVVSEEERAVPDDVHSGSSYKRLISEIKEHQNTFRHGMKWFQDAVTASEAHRQRIHEEYEQACEGVVKDVNLVCETLQSRLKGLLLEAKAHRDAEVKAIDTRLDSFTVATEQLTAGILQADRVLRESCPYQDVESCVESFRRMRALLDGFHGAQDHRTVRPSFDTNTALSSLSSLFSIQLVW